MFGPFRAVSLEKCLTPGLRLRFDPGLIISCPFGAKSILTFGLCEFETPELNI
jgi:hypothetical protein